MAKSTCAQLSLHKCDVLTEVLGAAVAVSVQSADGYLASCVSKGRLALFSENKTKVCPTPPLIHCDPCVKEAVALPCSAPCSVI